MERNIFKNQIITDDIDNIISNDLPWDKLANTNILITGANGMIPSYIFYTLIGLNESKKLNIKIYALVRNEEKARNIFGELLSRNDVTLLVQDVSEPLKLQESIDYIFHGASPVNPREHKLNPVNTIKANILGTINLLDFSVKTNATAFILMSSSEIYGSVDESISLISEEDYGKLDYLTPRSSYSESKRAAENICVSYASQYGMRCVIPRFGHIYGPGLSLTDGRAQSEFASNIVNNQDIILNSDGSSIRTYTYVSDAISGIFYSLLKGTDLVYNIANSDSVISIRELADVFIASRPGKNLKLRINIDNHDSGLYNPAKNIGLNISKIKSLGWVPQVSITEGIDRTISFLEQKC